MTEKNQIEEKQNFDTGMSIETMTLRLPEFGKIKIGRKGVERTSKAGKKWRQPEKLDHFLITKMSMGADGNFIEDSPTTEIVKSYLREKYDTESPKVTRIPVILPFDNPKVNLMTRITKYSGSKLVGESNGKQWWSIDPRTKGRTEIQQPNPAEMERDWKWTGVLSVLIQGAPRVGGVWKFRTTSYNSITDLMSSMVMIGMHTNGKLAGIPLELVVSPRNATDPDGRAQTIYSVHLEFPGSQKELNDSVAGIIEDKTRNEKRIRMMENAALEYMSPADFDDEEGVADEFFPPSRDELAKEAKQAGIHVKKTDSVEQIIEKLEDGVELEAEEIEAEETEEIEKTDCKKETKELHSIESDDTEESDELEETEEEDDSDDYDIDDLFPQ